jgi:hypothetical protein
VITRSGKTKPIDPPEINPKKRASKEIAAGASPKKGKGRVAAKAPAQAMTQIEESESIQVDRRKPSTRSKTAAKDTPSSRRAGKPKPEAASEALAIDQDEGPVETSRRRKAVKSSKSKKDAPPDPIPAPTSSFKLDIPTRRGQKRKMDEPEGDEPSVEVPPKKKRKALYVEDEAPAPSRPLKTRKSGHNIADTDADIPRLPSKKRRNAPVTIDEEASAHVTQTKANTDPLPHVQSFAETTSSIRSASQAPNRVFAKWGGNGMYYCGTLRKMEKRDDGVRVCIVEYDDGEVAQVTLEGLRRCEVWVGDVVEIPASKGKIRKSATVASVDEWEEHGRVRVSVAKGKGKSKARPEEIDIQSRDVSVPATQVEAGVSWTERRLSAEDLEACVPGDETNYENGDESYRDHAEETMQETLNPAPVNKSHSNAISGTRRSTRTMDSAPISKGVARSTKRTSGVREVPYNSVARSKVNPQPTLPFAGDAFLIAISLSDRFTRRTSDSKERERTKKRLQESITRQGGVCIEDWDDLLQVQATVDERRWIWEKSDGINYSRVQSGKGLTRKKPNIDRVWILADEPNMHTKYFTALALGVPCVSSRWVEDGVRGPDCFSREIFDDLVLQAKYPWSSYLLPAGHSSVLGQECAQIINHDYADYPRTIKQLIDNPGSVRKPFAGKSILFVGTSDRREKVCSLLRYNFFWNILTSTDRFLRRTSKRNTLCRSLPARWGLSALKSSMT